MLLGQFANVFTRIWLSHAIDRLERPRPELRNTDGHEIVVSKVRCPAAAGAEGEIERRLDDADFLSRDADDKRRWSWMQAEDATRSGGGGETGEHGHTWDTRDEGGWTILGNVELAKGTLVLDVNSRERAERGTTLLAALLGPLVGPPLASTQTVDQALADHEKKPDAAPVESPVPPEVAAEVIGEYLDRHYRESLDAPIPMLDGKPPRQAVRGKKGRQQVAAWLKYLENQDARRAPGDPLANYDFMWMWEELGILELRR